MAITLEPIKKDRVVSVVAPLKTDNGNTSPITLNIAQLLKAVNPKEISISKCGYWLETDPETSKVISMTVFIKEAESDETFYSYKWAE